MENIGFGLNMMGMGMGLVFSMLLLLWGVLAILGRLDPQPAKAKPAAAPAPAVTVAPAVAIAEQPVLQAVDEPAEQVVDRPLVHITIKDEQGRLTEHARAMITVAVLAHISNRRRQAAPALRHALPGSQLFASRWVASGRGRQNDSWQRRR